MKGQKIELPPLPDLLALQPEVFDRGAKVVSETMAEQLMHDYARASIEADRKRRGEPVAWEELAASWLREKASAQQTLNELYPEHAKCYPTWENWVLKLNWLADELSAGTDPQPAEKQPSSDVAEALTELCDEIDKHEIHAAISTTNISWFKRKARKALAAYRKQGVKQ